MESQPVPMSADQFGELAATFEAQQSSRDWNEVEQELNNRMAR